MEYYVFITGFLLIIIGFIFTAINIIKKREHVKYRKFIILGAIMIFSSLLIGMYKNGVI